MWRVNKIVQARSTRTNYYRWYFPAANCQSILLKIKNALTSKLRNVYMYNARMGRLERHMWEGPTSKAPQHQIHYHYRQVIHVDLLRRHLYAMFRQKRILPEDTDKHCIIWSLSNNIPLVDCIYGADTRGIAQQHLEEIKKKHCHQVDCLSLNGCRIAMKF